MLDVAVRQERSLFTVLILKGWCSDSHCSLVLISCIFVWYSFGFITQLLYQLHSFMFSSYFMIRSVQMIPLFGHPVFGSPVYQASE